MHYRGVTTEGTVPFGHGGEELETWYRVDGDLRSGVPPLIGLHGGPGATHDYLRTLAALAVGGRAVVLYDQAGNGRSSHRPDRGADFWTVDLFVAELHNLVAALGIDDHDVLGQSWGGFLAQEYALTRPPGLRRLVLADTAASFPAFVAECNRLRALLPPEVEATLRRHGTRARRATPSARRPARSSTAATCAGWSRGRPSCTRASPGSSATRPSTTR
jgi:L-proline amide hydrolase